MPSTLRREEVRATSSLPLRVVNGMSTPSASTVTAATAGTSVAPGSSIISPVEGLPRNSAMWGVGGGGLVTHVEHEEESSLAGDDESQLPEAMRVERAPRAINPCLETLEKAAAAKIYFENLYFPLLRHPPFARTKAPRHGEGNGRDGLA